jgi:hypothetical protein
MTKYLFLFLAFVVGSAASVSVNAQPAPRGFSVADIVLYQPNEVMAQRVPDVGKLADYIKKLEAILGGYFVDDSSPENFHTVVALRPGGRVAVWFVTSNRAGTDAALDALRKELESVPPIDVQNGPVVFDISAKLAGGDPAHSTEADNGRPVIPKEWQDAAKNEKTALSLDDYLNLVWP